MAKEFAKAFYSSTKWLKCRQSFIKYRQSIDGGLCESCHERIGYIVHHKIMLTPENISDPDISLNFRNLKYDCHLCHNKEHGIGSEPERLTRFEFSPDGEIVLTPP